jgi:S-adenosylmethionine/arginine decarboxylase-like enzyme
MKEYTNSNKESWGFHTIIDGFDCNPEKIRDAEYIRKFVIELCDLIEMKRFGEPFIVKFGEDPRVTGYSMLQLIETSNLACHYAENTNSFYLDIFSCKKYDVKKAVEFCTEFFEAKSHVYRYIER